MLERSAGFLLHPTSLPGPYGIGDLGPQADRFLTWAERGGQSWWQTLPLGPTGVDGSPYSARSLCAGNPLLISPERLLEDGLLAKEELERARGAKRGPAEFAAARRSKNRLLDRAWKRFRSAPPEGLRHAFERFRDDEVTRLWLDDWCLFAALERRHRGRPWWRWDRPLARRHRRALDGAREALSEPIERYAFEQFLFERQWRQLRGQSEKRGIRLFGDQPIYPALHSVDVWSARSLFDLDRGDRPRSVGGVPPDYFNADGQRWGNPVYRWDRVADDGFRWWVDRIRVASRRFDLLRLDHFRGFVAAWNVPASARTARKGRWVAGPGRTLFDAVEDELGKLPFVAEDLGEIDRPVLELRDALGLPGMRILQFGFDEPDSPHAPHRHPVSSVVYTGTHDNDTTEGWAKASPPERLERLAAYAGEAESASARLIRLAYTSPARLAMVPVQDVLGLGTSARMNVPGKARGNWAWRLDERELRTESVEQLASLATLTGRRG